jgi:hypothetical protein
MYCSVVAVIVVIITASELSHQWYDFFVGLAW